MMGNLYLIPTLLGDSEPLEVLPASIFKIIDEVDDYIVENEKSARRFIKLIAPEKPQSQLNIMSIDKYADVIETQRYLDNCEKGISVGLLSEAGVPAIADPGAAMVKLAHQKNIKVVPLVGPSSILLAMMSSGLNGQNFAFNGYLPIDKNERKKVIKDLENLSFDKKQAQIFIETPYRNQKLFEDLMATLSPSTYLSIAADITLASEFIKTNTVQNWKKNQPDLHKRPSIFTIQK